MSIYKELKRLINYGIDKGLIEEVDVIYCYNRLLERLSLEGNKGFNDILIPNESYSNLNGILENILDWSVENGLIEDLIGDSDRLDTELMDILTPRPSTVIENFNKLYRDKPELGTNYYYNLSKYTNYIRTNRIEKNHKWITPTSYGNLEITINLSKPEKDPRAIAAAKKAGSTKYPKCFLCKENMGYMGRLDHPARANHRIIPFDIQGERWFMQYSPYVYFNEHCILFSDEHRDMTIGEESLEEILQWVTALPHYFAGSNAELPIVGGSILSHAHFQGGKHDMPITGMEDLWKTKIQGYDDTIVSIVNWPMSVIRLTGKDKSQISRLGATILENWRGYTNKALGIISHTKDVPHNTITPIARRKGDDYQMDLVLRNNRTSDEHPFGIFHPHEDLHHIKKENIGLIEVMGLAVLPGRLIEEMKALSSVLESGVEVPAQLSKHKTWIEDIRSEYMPDKTSSVEFLEYHVGLRFLRVLEDAGVFKKDDLEAFKGFISSIN